MPITIKAIGYPGGVMERTISVETYNELDSWILDNVDPTGRYEVRCAGSAQPVATPADFDQLIRSSQAVVLHVRPQAAVVQPAAAEVPQVSSLGRLAPPREVSMKQTSDGSPPVASWKEPDGGPVVAHYKVRVVNESGELLVQEDVQVPSAGRNPQFPIHGALPDTAHRIEVAAVNESGVAGTSRSADFFVEKKLQPDSPEAHVELERVSGLLLPWCQEFTTAKNRSPLFLIIGKQHHGKSSLINHFKRCLTHSMDIPDEVEAAPPSENETTIRTKFMDIKFHDQSFTFCDVPAFSTMNEARKRDLDDLLWRVSSDWARGEGSWWCAANPPDAAIVVVSLMSWRDERDSLRDYLKELQAVLKCQRNTNSKAVFPFVVAATHKDKFLEEEGNQGRDPLARLMEAEKELKSMANTNHVFVLYNYDNYAWWAPKVTEKTYRMLREVTNLAKNRTETAQEWYFGAEGLVVGVLVTCVLGILIGTLTKNW